MIKRLVFCLISLNIALIACSPVEKVTSDILDVAVPLKQADQHDINEIAQSLQISYRLITNIPSEKCDAKIANGACFEVELTLGATKSIQSNNWSIYFSQVSPIISSESKEFSIEHINGDLHKISLTNNYQGFNEGEDKKIIFRAMFWSLSEYDAMPNYIVSAENLEARVIKSTRSEIDPDTQLEILPFVVPYTDFAKQFKRTSADSTKLLTPQRLYQRNLAVNDETVNVQSMILPSPKQMTITQGKSIDLSSGVIVKLNNVELADVSVALNRIEKFGISFNSNKSEKAKGTTLALKIIADNKKKIGSYQLTISEQAIEVTGVDASGVFNGLQSLASLVTIGSTKLPVVTVVDEPHYEFRGMLVDVARNFHSKEFILKLLEQMAAYKLNKLHLHLGDDEGWRLEIPGLPELTDIGAHRCFDSQESECLIAQLGAGTDKNSAVNGYYSVSDYQEILRAASARHIQVIPSLDMPGHSRAAVKAMTARYHKYRVLEEQEKAEQFLLHDIDDQTVYSSVQFYNDNTINVCLESSFSFIEEVMAQVKSIHQQAEHPLTRYHIGADETAGAWIDSPSCKDFIENNEHGVHKMSELGAYFVERVANILADLNIETAAWSDGLEHTRTENMPAIVQANAWGLLPWQSHKQTHELVNRNWQVVLSTPDALYFDFPYEADPKEHGYYWASRHINTEKIFQFMPDNLPVHAEFWLDREENPFESDDRIAKNDQGEIISGPLAQGRKFLGIQGQLWSENTRTDIMVEHKIFPRLLALAERAWHRAHWAVPYNYEGFKYDRNSHVFDDQQRNIRDAQWQKFAQLLGQKELKKLEQADINYRLPTVGAQITHGVLTANIAFPGLTIEYKDGDKPWQLYTEPSKVTTDVKIRSQSYNTERKGRTTIIDFPQKD